MKRMLAFLLCAVLLISCLPLTAMAAKSDTAQTSAASVEQKFRLLLEDLELVAENPDYEYFYEELGQYPAKNPEWILISGGLLRDVPQGGWSYHYAVFGNKLIRGNTESLPFKLGYGVYDVKSGAFYDLIDAWDMNLNHLRDVWDDIVPCDYYDPDHNAAENAMYTIGDADVDGEVTILDATRIQRCLAELDENPWQDFAAAGSEFIRGADIAGATDYDRDGDTTVMDATRIQRGIAELPNILTARISASYNAYDHGSESAAQLLTDHAALKKCVRNYTDQSIHNSIYPEDDFKVIELVGVYLKLYDASDSLTLQSAEIDSSGVLNLNFKAKCASGSKSDPRLVLVEIPNTFIDDIDDIKVNLSFEKTFNAYILMNQSVSASYTDDDPRMITEYHQLDPTDSFDAKLKTYLDENVTDIDKDFEQNAYLLMTVPLGSSDTISNLLDVHIDSKEILRINIFVSASNSGNSSAGNNRFVCIKLTKSYLEDSKDWKADVIYEHPVGNTYRLAWDKRIYEEPDESFEPKLLITDRDQLDAEKSDRKMILDAYDSDYFKDQSLIALNIYLGSGSYVLTLNDVSLDNDGVLKIDFSRNHPSGVSDDINHRFIVIEIPKTTADQVKNIDVFIEGEFYQDFYRPAKHPYLYVQPAAGDNAEASLYTSRDQLDPKLKGHQRLLDDYDEHFFENSAILTVHYYLPCETMLYEFSGIDVFKGTVRVWMKEMTPEINHDPGVNVSYCFEVGKSWIADATNGTQVIHEPVAAGTSVFNENIKIHDRPAIPAGSYTKIGSLSEPYHKILTDEVYSTALIEARGSGDTNGVAAVITNPQAMEDMIHDPSLGTGCIGNSHWFFYEINKDYTYGYDLNFFDQYALVAIAASENANETLTINGMYKVGNTLYIDAELVCPTALAPMYHDCVTFVKIYKEDLEGVTAVSVGKLGTAPEVNDDVPFRVTEDESVSGYFSEKQNNAYQLIYPSQVGEAIDALYTDVNGDPVDHSDRRYDIESYRIEAFSNHHYIAMRVYQGSSDTELTVDRVWRSNDTCLRVELTRTVPENPSPDSRWRIIFLEIPDVGKQFTVTVNVTVKQQPH